MSPVKLVLGRHGAHDVRSETQTLVQVVRVALLVALGVALVGCWLWPWQYAEGNPDLSGVPTATASARVVAGCRVGDSRNLINCIQYVDFDAGSTQVRGAAVHVADGFRKGDPDVLAGEDAADVPIVYDIARPQRSVLARGNPGTLTLLLGTVWMTTVTFCLGAWAGYVLDALLFESFDARRSATTERRTSAQANPACRARAERPSS